MGLTSSSLYYCCTLEEGGCIDYSETDDFGNNLCNVQTEAHHAFDTNFCTEEACAAYSARELYNETCFHLKYSPPLTEQQQWILSMFAAGCGVLVSYLSLFCLTVLFSPRYAIFRVFLSSFSLSLLISMAIFELLPATIGMNECEMALWPHWPVHAALMYIAFWLFYALDRIISVVGSNQQDHRQTINDDLRGMTGITVDSYREDEDGLTEVERVRAASSVSRTQPPRHTVTSITAMSGHLPNKDQTAHEESEAVKGTSFGAPLEEYTQKPQPHNPDYPKPINKRKTIDFLTKQATDDNAFMNDAFDMDEPYQQKDVINTQRTTILRRTEIAGEPTVRKSVRITERPTEIYQTEKHQDERIHKHGISCENLKMISGTAWVIIIGDSIENIVHGIAIAAAFNESFPAGIGITIAFVIEEFLHKLNDFAMVMASGMNTHEAIFFNVISSLPMFLGIVIGELLLHFSSKPEGCAEYDENWNGEITCNDPEQYCAAAALGLTIYVAFGAVLGEANAAEINCQQSNGMSRTKILILQQLSTLLGLVVCVLLTCLSPRTIFSDPSTTANTSPSLTTLF